MVWESFVLFMAYLMLTLDLDPISQTDDSNLNVNYYMYALSRCHPNGNWTIHGLWPQHNTTSWPQYCTNEPFNYTTLYPILNELKLYWSACDKPWDQQFWQHEWSKHGTCSSMSQLEYFNTTLQLYVRHYSTFFYYVCANHHMECNVPIFNVHK